MAPSSPDPLTGQPIVPANSHQLGPRGTLPAYRLSIPPPHMADRPPSSCQCGCLTPPSSPSIGIWPGPFAFPYPSSLYPSSLVSTTGTSRFGRFGLSPPLWLPLAVQTKDLKLSRRVIPHFKLSHYKRQCLSPAGTHHQLFRPIDLVDRVLIRPPEVLNEQVLPFDGIPRARFGGAGHTFVWYPDANGTGKPLGLTGGHRVNRFARILKAEQPNANASEVRRRPIWHAYGES